MRLVRSWRGAFFLQEFDEIANFFVGVEDALHELVYEACALMAWR